MSTPIAFCVACAALGAPQVHFAWQVQRRKHLQGVWGRSATIDHYRSRILRGRPSTWTISVSFCVAGAPLEASPERSGEGCRRLITLDACCFCVAGAAPTSRAFCVVVAMPVCAQDHGRYYPTPPHPTPPQTEGEMMRLQCLCVRRTMDAIIPPHPTPPHPKQKER